MKKQLRYTETDKMSDLICENYTLLQVMSRFGLSLGFGDKNVKEVCELQGVDHKTFLAVVNFMEEGFTRMGFDDTDISIQSLMDYLRQAHSYFLEFCLPDIRQKLVNAINRSENEVSSLILKFFDDYVREVRRHMEYENNKVFNYATALLEGKTTDTYQIQVFARKHDQIESKLTELKNIIIKYYPTSDNYNQLNAVLFDIFSCEKDLESHCKVEDYLFVPAILKLEKKILHE
ncbi:MAG: hemerythrin domain-containing protein [Bacteroides sp.]|nr:hemerythrin domain-containing protein [Bacteroides sp.]